jgi:CRISPR type III-B/RAMP module RAMP protein Cmr1
MIASPYTFECITPCFCAGADQTKAEIRPSSIRGALRWWFRALGGSKDLETEVFGGADPIAASSILIRVSKIDSRAVGRLPQPQGIDPLSYILYFPSISSDRKRWNESACYGPGTTFQMDVKQTRKLSKDAEICLDAAILAFRHFGSIGMHVTRGLGAVQCSKVDADSRKLAIELIEGAGFTYRQSTQNHKIWDAVLKEAGQWLQNDLRKEFGAGGNKKPAQATGLGSALPVRQTSAVYIHPIKQNDNLIFAAFEAPHDKILGTASKRPHIQPILKSRDFTKAPPQAPQQGRPRFR